MGRLPNLIVVGAAKCGTTSLYVYLARHPQVHMSRRKELNFFTTEDNWGRGVDWYASHFDAPGRLVYGEASPRYTTWPLHEGVAERMHALVPEARLIYVVRDPIDRMVSNWAMRVKLGREDRPMDVALRDLSSHRYLSRSRYHLQLERLLENFPEKQVLVLDADDLRDRRRPTMREVFRFLGVDEDHASPLDRVNHNQSVHQRPMGRGIVPGRVRALIGRGYAALGRPAEHPEPSPELRAWAADQLRDDVAELRARTGRAFAGWSL